MAPVAVQRGKDAAEVDCHQHPLVVQRPQRPASKGAAENMKSMRPDVITAMEGPEEVVGDEHVGGAADQEEPGRHRMERHVLDRRHDGDDHECGHLG